MKNTMKEIKAPTIDLLGNTDRNELSRHFTLKEFTRSGTAIKNGWENEPDDLHIYCMRLLCKNVLEPLRLRFGVIKITSGFRTKQLNDAVHGAEFSQHTQGKAADVYVPNPEVGKKMYEFLIKNTDFDQLIYEYDKKKGRQWLHVSYNHEGNRHQYFMNYIM